MPGKSSHSPDLLMRLVAVALISMIAVPGMGCATSRQLANRMPSGASASAATAKRPRPVNPHKAMEWRRLRWKDENGRIDPAAVRCAGEQRAANLAYWAAQGGTANLTSDDWTELGPNNVGGRTRSLVIHPTQTNRMWAGSVSGGIWYSSNSGAGWAPVDDFMPNLAVCCLTMDPANPNVMYAGTGEGFFNGDAIGGLGIFKSVDGGVSWDQLPNTYDWGTVNRIAVSPDNSNVLLAAQRYNGIRRSTDGGLTWSSPYWAQGSFFVAFDPADGNKAVAQVIDYDWGANDWFHRALYSLNGGQTWNVAGGLSQVWGFGSRIELAYAESAPGTVYASSAENGGKFWRSTDGGQNYTLQTTGGTSSGCSWYANPLWVDPTHSNVLVTGGVHIFRSSNSGVSMSQISNGYIMTTQPHPDIHFITHDPGFNGTSNRRVYVCTDGGIWKTDDIYNASVVSGWTKLEQSYRTTQYYGAAGDGPSGLVIGGTQDNGTLRSPTGTQTASLMFGGDGGFCAIDPTNTNYCYGEYVALQIHRSTNGGISSSYIYSGIGDADAAANFIAPFILDPNNSNTMLAGGASLWRSNNVKATTPSWSSIRSPGSDYISAIAVAPGNSNIIWVGQNNGAVSRTTNGTAANPVWITVDNNGSPNPLPDRYVTRILIDPQNSNLIYIAFGGFSGDNLWRSLNGGTSWTDITGIGASGLPDAPIYGIARHPDDPNYLFVATEVGVYSTTAGGMLWTAENVGPANVSVDEIVFMHNSRKLLAATHGRGLWSTAVCPPTVGSTPCDDFNLCTNDSCHPLNGCVHIANSNVCDDGDECTRNDVCTGGVCTGEPFVVLFGDVAPPGGNLIVNLDDLLCVLNGFGAPASCPGADLVPCGGNGVVNLDDILAELAAFAGTYVCPSPCPP